VLEGAQYLFRLAFFEISGASSPDASASEHSPRDAHGAGPLTTTPLPPKDRVLSVSGWDTRSAAETRGAAVSAWVVKNMTEISLIDVHYGKIAPGTSLGVSTSDRATL